jgi:hypothetical protein
MAITAAGVDGVWEQPRSRGYSKSLDSEAHFAPFVLLSKKKEDFQEQSIVYKFNPSQILQASWRLSCAVDMLRPFSKLACDNSGFTHSS